MANLTRKEFRMAVLANTRKAHDGALCCTVCGPGKVYEAKDIVADHIDNNPKNNDPDTNGQALCRSHNYAKNPPKLYVLKGQSLDIEREWERTRERLKVETLAMEKNRVGQPAFEKWLYSEMLKHNKLGLRDAIDSGSFASKIGPDTVYKRYILPMTSRVAYLKIDTEETVIDGKPEKIEVVLWRDREKFMREYYKDFIKKYGK